ncbi:hypothetical protein N7G274_005205 [Stereocaulon virgatum]|uniref:Uncharacterized protein n=1 Tax=Stereocaulon virgatum TaxID=373712 RepID=A0ABR4ABZ4_9LECA
MYSRIASRGASNRISKGTKTEPAFLDATGSTMRDTKTDIGSAGEIKSTQNDQISPSKTHPSTPATASGVTIYTLTNILDLARSTAETDFTTPELRELILDMKAWLARVNSELDWRQQRGMLGKGEAKTHADLEERQRGRLLILAEIGSII